MTEEQRKATITALLREKASYEYLRDGAEDSETRAKWTDRAEQVDAQLTAYGHTAKTPSQRAERRPARTAETRKSE